MQLQTNLVRRQSRFYFRSRVPNDLKSHYGKNEIMVSLNTSDKRIADYELIKFKMKLYAEFARLRGDVFESEPEAEPISDTQQQTKTTSSSQNSSKIASVVSINAGPTIEKLIEYWSSQETRD